MIVLMLILSLRVGTRLNYANHDMFHVMLTSELQTTSAFS